MDTYAWCGESTSELNLFCTPFHGLANEVHFHAWQVHIGQEVVYYAGAPRQCPGAPQGVQGTCMQGE